WPGRSAQRQRYHRASVVARPCDTGQDVAVRSGALVAEHLARVDLRAGGDPVTRALRGVAWPAGGADAVGAVAMSVGGVLTVHKRPHFHVPVGEIRVVGGETGVQDRDPDPGSGGRAVLYADGLQPSGQGFLRAIRPGLAVACPGFRRRGGVGLDRTFWFEVGQWSALLDGSGQVVDLIPRRPYHRDPEVVQEQSIGFPQR